MSSEGSTPLKSQARIFAYIDGFNAYYGLKYASQEADKLHLEHGGDPAACLGRSLYWLNLESVVLSQVQPSERCLAIKYFSAPRRVPRRAKGADKTPYIESNERQRLYLEALETSPLIEIVLGWYTEGTPHRCRKCEYQWPNFEEKVTDVNIATHMLVDAFSDRFDVALVFSADADLVPPVRALRALGKRVVVGLFPGRRLASNLNQHTDEVRNIRLRTLRSRQFADVLTSAGGQQIRRPDRWSVPGGWTWSKPAPVPYYRALTSK